MRNIILPLLIVLAFGSLAFAADAPAKPVSRAGAQVSTQLQLAAKAPGALLATQNSPATAAVKAPASVPKKMQTNRAFTISMFLLIIAATAGIVVWASRSTSTAADYYAASGSISGMQNGWAIAGDFLSAATFLGITGLMSLFGPDGFMYSVGIIISF